MPAITLNGQPHSLEQSCTVADLLQSLDLQDKPVVVELDGNALTRDDHSVANVHDGARVEVIVLAAGG